VLLRSDGEEQYVAQLSSQAFGNTRNAANRAAALAMLQELYWYVLFPLPTAPCATTCPSPTFKPLTTAPSTVLFPFDVRFPPTRITPFQVVLPLIVKFPVTMSVPRPSPGREKLPFARMTGQ